MIEQTEHQIKLSFKQLLKINCFFYKFCPINIIVKLKQSNIMLLNISIGNVLLCNTGNKTLKTFTEYKLVAFSGKQQNEKKHSSSTKRNH